MEKEADRKDQTDKLGKALSITEMRTYLVINSHGLNPITTEKISEELYVLSPKEYSEYNIWNLIGGIRKKLGDESIETHSGRKGYTTRRSRIDLMVKKNIQRSKKYRKEADRKDQTDKLGKALSMTEMRTYLTIDLHGSNPIGTEEISETLRIPGEREYTENYVQVLIGRIREKLGDESIISYFGEGYTTRRAEIEDQVEKRIQ